MRRSAKPTRPAGARERGFRGGAVLVAALAAAACAGPPPAAAPPVLRIANRSAAAVRAIETKPCGAPAAAFRALPESALEPGQERRLVLERGCLDLVARDRHGRAVALQQGLQLPPDAEWTLR